MRTERERRRIWTAGLLAACLLLTGSCGGAAGPKQLGQGTVSILNESDQGQAPLTVTAFYLAPIGDPNPGPNLLNAPIPPGGIVIVGLFTEGLYDALLVLESGGSIPMLGVLVRRDQPTNLVVP